MTIPSGRINRLFGTNGGVMISLYADFPEDFDPETSPMIVSIDQLEVPLWCASFEKRGVSGAVVTFEDFDTDRRAEELLGKEFYVPESDEYDEEDDDEFYMEDLIGFAVEANGMEGEVTDYYDSEMNPLFEITVGGREILIPAAEEFIAHIDFEEQKIKMVLPEGLLNLE